MGNANTKKAYAWGGKLWKAFCAATGRAIVPAGGVEVALCMKSLFEKGYARGTICNILLGAIHGLHLQAGLPSPTKSDYVRAAKRMITAHTPAPVPKRALTRQTLLDMVLASNTSLEDARDLCMFVYGAAGTLRPWNVSALVFEDVNIGLFEGVECVSLFIQKAKNDQARIGHHILLGRAEDFRVCPVVHTKRYLGLRSPQATSFFHSVRSPSKPCPTGTIRNRLKRFLARAGLPQEEIRFFSAYSLRCMGASNAAQAGVPDRLLTRHGGWARNSKSVELYVDQALDAALTVSQSIMNTDTKQLVFRGDTRPRGLY
jgi:hypothetical protein